MAYEVLASKTQWTTSNPSIYFKIDYDSRRVNEKMAYTFKITFYPVTGSSYFAYPIYLDLTLNGEKIYDKKTLKKYGEQYQTWQEFSWETSESITESTQILGTIPVQFRFYSAYGSTRDVTYIYNLPVLADGIVYISGEPYRCYINNGTNWELYAPYISNGADWQRTEV